MTKRFIVVGHGALAQQLLCDLPTTAARIGYDLQSVAAWDNLDPQDDDGPVQESLIIHVGSGRQLAEVIDFCQSNGVPLLQASTGIDMADLLPSLLAFAVVEASNLAIPIVKLLHMMRTSGHLFRSYDVSIVESHQQAKRSVAGTALELARALGKRPEDVLSIRDPKLQHTAFDIPPDHLRRHALHILKITDGDCHVTLRTEVQGLDPYVRGVLAIAENVDTLAPARYKVTDLIDQGVL